VFVMGLLDLLTEELDKPVGGVNFMSKANRVDTAKCIDMVQRIRANIPAGIRYSNHLAKEQERVLRNAEEIAAKRAQAAQQKYNALKAQGQADANAMIADAKQKAEKMLAGANQRAEAIISRARENAAQMISESEIVRQAKKQAAEIRKRSIND